MLRTPNRVQETFILAAMVLITSGCGGPASGDGTGRALLDQGAAFLLAEEPDEVVGVIEARENLNETKEVAVIGRIGGVAQPWQTDQATFVMADPSVDAVEGADLHNSECDDGCAFCAKAKAENATLKLAIVRIIDENGEVVPHDARRLFAIETGQLVVAQGRARVDNLGNLILSAASIYVRR